MHLRDAPEVALLLWGLLANAAWELLQSPLYADAGSRWTELLWTRFHCTLGDGLILLASFWATSLAFGSRSWFRRPRLSAIVLFVGLGLAYTVWSEWWNTRVVGSWAYGAAMPTVGGIGIAPLLQWIVVPLFVLSRLRRRLRPSRPTGADERRARPPAVPPPASGGRRRGSRPSRRD